MTEDTPRYTTFTDLDDVEEFYWVEVAPEFRATGGDPDTEKPKYEWLNQNYPGLIKHLQREFGLSFGDFVAETGLIDEGSDNGTAFAHLDDDRTRTALQEYISELETRRGLATATVETRQSILRKYTETYRDVNDTTDLLSPLYDTAARGAEMDRVADTFDVMRRAPDSMTTLGSKRKHAQIVRRFYRHLVVFGDAAYNPMELLEERFGWDETPTWDNQPLGKDSVQNLYRAAETTENRLIVVGVCGWGLRPSEVAALHTDQLHLSPEEEPTPYIEFDDGERKNGPGTVTLLTGVPDLNEQIDSLAAEYGDVWSGYLFPSPVSNAGHLTPGTIRNRFKKLASDAAVRVNGEVPTPKMGRRFWYTLYGDAVSRIVDRFDDIADEQGSSDASVVLENYLSESEKRAHRRREMQDELNGLFQLDD